MQVVQLLKPRQSSSDIGMRQSKEVYRQQDTSANLLPKIASVHSVVGTALIKQRSATDRGGDILDCVQLRILYLQN